VKRRSEQTPPPETIAHVMHGDGCPFCS
jgi:hypothetical protein